MRNPIGGRLRTLVLHNLRKRFAYPEDVDSAPEKNGIYVIYDAQDRAIYIGKSDSQHTTIRSRLKDHVDGKDPENTRCIQNHRPVSFAYETSDEITGKIADYETEYIKDYRDNGQASCNNRL